MSFSQPPLPFAMDAMKPFLSEEQLTFHYGKHHAAYFKNLNGLVEGKPEASLSLREVVVGAAPGPIFNNAAQAWNHSFYWDCISPDGGGEPKGELAAAIDRDFGSLAAMRKEMSDAAVKLFGSGWAWLAADKQGKLEIMSLGNADTPLKHGKEPVLTIDVWEHAYYVDYRNDRAKYVEGFWDVVNWDFAAKCYAAATK
ncbi:MAG TPA: superoxide dismutase [Fe] [Planctomycetaceae bacterium]|nr:superoxide dismutase [Fe] [Planctomycetaceae bacterium]